MHRITRSLNKCLLSIVLTQRHNEPNSLIPAVASGLSENSTPDKETEAAEPPTRAALLGHQALSLGSPRILTQAGPASGAHLPVLPPHFLSGALTMSH